MSDDSSRQPPAEPPSRSGLPQWLGGFLERLGLRSGGSIRDEIMEALAEGNGQIADLSPQERAMLTNVLGLRERRVGDVMIPRADILAAPAEGTIGSLLHVFKAAGHSRLPVYHDTLDDPRGMVHIRDLFDFIAERAITEAGVDLGAVDLAIPLTETDIVRPVLYVPPTMPAVDLLVRMQATRTHIALVIDEYGGTDGLVSSEDLIEIVVGEIEDEHDLDEGPAVIPAGEDRFTADARASLEEVRDVTGIDLTGLPVAEDVDTIGGLVATLAGHVPAPGEKISGLENVEFEVLDGDQRRIKRLRLHRIVPEQAQSAADEA